MAVTRQVPIEVFVAAGADRWHDAQALRSHPLIRLVPTPRHASALLVAGTIPDAHRAALARVHDQMPHPRTTVTWKDVDGGPDVVDAVARTLVERTHAVISDPSSSSLDRLADEEPNEWRGVGPFGQGGEGMMGGTPYGRPMTMTADDRDGLTLDQLELRLGPFLSQLPGGLVADVALQGEVIQSIEFACAGDVALVHEGRELTVNRRLLWLSHALHVQGLDAFAVRSARLARRSAPDDGDISVSRDFASLRRRLRWTGLHSALRGTGEHDGNDTWSRWSASLDAISGGLGQADARLARADDEAGITASELADTLVGMTLTDAVTTVVGFDIDVPATMTATVVS